MSEDIRPDYYQRDGQDLLDRFEAGLLSHDEFVGFMAGNVIKYVVRHQGKNGVEDLVKARTYLNRLIKVEEENHEDKKTN